MVTVKICPRKRQSLLHSTLSIPWLMKKILHTTPSWQAMVKKNVWFYQYWIAYRNMYTCQIKTSVFHWWIFFSCVGQLDIYDNSWCLPMADKIFLWSGISSKWQECKDPPLFEVDTAQRRNTVENANLMVICWLAQILLSAYHDDMVADSELMEWSTTDESYGWLRGPRTFNWKPQSA